MKILFYIIGSNSLGHINRALILAKNIARLNPNIKIIFVSDNPFTNGLQITKIDYIDISAKVNRSIKSDGGSLEKSHNLILEPILKEYNPDMVLFDTFFPIDMIKNNFSKKTKKVLILRKYKESELEKFFRKKYYQFFDLILVPHLKEEFDFQKYRYDGRFKFVGSIVKNIKNSDIIKIKRIYNIKQKEFTILVNCGGGGLQDSSLYLKTVVESYKRIKNQISNLKFIIIAGPLNREFENIKKIEDKNTIVKKFEPNLLELMTCCNLMICKAGYNTINEILVSKIPSILIPMYRDNEDQTERALHLRKKTDIEVLTEFNSEKLSKAILNFYNNPDKLEKIKKNFDKIKLEIGNEKAAIEILNLLKEKKYGLKVGQTCNNNCVFCDLLNIKEKYDKSLVEIKKELDHLKEKNYSHIILPCNADIRKDFFEILKYAKNLSFKITLETNGRIFSYEKFALKSSKYIGKFIVFLNSNNELIHNKITNTDNSFKQVIKGIKNIKKLNKEIQINTVITNYNYKNLKEIVSLIKTFGIKDFRPIFPVVKSE